MCFLREQGSRYSLSMIPPTHLILPNILPMSSLLQMSRSGASGLKGVHLFHFVRRHASPEISGSRSRCLDRAGWPLSNLPAGQSKSSSSKPPAFGWALGRRWGRELASPRDPSPCQLAEISKGYSQAILRVSREALYCNPLALCRRA